MIVLKYEAIVQDLRTCYPKLRMGNGMVIAGV